MKAYLLFVEKDSSSGYLTSQAFDPMCIATSPDPKKGAFFDGQQAYRAIEALEYAGWTVWLEEVA